MIFCVLLLWMPKRIKQANIMQYHMETLRYQLLEIQERAQTEKVIHHVSWDGSTMMDNEKQIQLAIQCKGSVIFHENGNVDQAKTILCMFQGKKGELVILLGNGRMYVKK